MKKQADITVVSKHTCAAQYIRMSTEHQQYSPQNQADTINQYACAHQMDIVRTYADHGRSGLKLKGRPGLRTLLDDVASNLNQYTVLLVYDVSRWGRFQDVDESAYYEFQLKKAGIRIHYCAEHFSDDGSIQSVLFKTIKRTMAAEYSRELSAKVFAGQCRLIEHGYRQGGLAGFGLRRQLIDRDGNLKARLGVKEHKSIHTDRIILVPGPRSEVATVKRIYRDFKSGKRETQIANELNAEGLRYQNGKPWAPLNVHEVLTNPKYAGVNVYNRRSFKLKQKRVQNAPEMWIQKDGAFKHLVSKTDFVAVQNIFRARNRFWTNQEMLERLRELLKTTGRLSYRIIDKAESIPRSQSYARRFGGLTRAYAAIGWVPERDCTWTDSIQTTRVQRDLLVNSIEHHIKACGGSSIFCRRRNLLTINSKVEVIVRVARCYQRSSGPQWRIKIDHSGEGSLLLVARLNPGNESVKDYYLLPPNRIPELRLRMNEVNPARLEVHRVDDLNVFYKLCT